MPSSVSLPGIQPRLHRLLQLALFGASLSWAVVANLIATRAARGLAVRLMWSDEFLLLDGVFLVFLLAIGFAALDGIGKRHVPIRRTPGLPRRPTARAEWTTGAAVGWGAALAAVLPMALAGALHVRFWAEGRSVWLAGLNLATVGLLALAAEMVFRGYPYQSLIGAVGPSWATVVMCVVSGLAVTVYQASTLGQGSTYLSTLIAMLFAAVLCSAWLRTHGLWLGWGLHFAWIASLGILFGLPVSGVENLSSLVETRAIGARWLTGGELGAEGALFTLLVMVVVIVVVVKVSGEWAWEYTRPALIPAGYAMDVAPPAEHVEMEKQAVKAPVLVQILPAAPLARAAEEDR